MARLSSQLAWRPLPHWLRFQVMRTPALQEQQLPSHAHMQLFLPAMIRFTHTESLSTSAQVRIQKQRQKLRALSFVFGVLLLAVIIPVSPLPHLVGIGAAFGPSVAKDTPSYPAAGATPTPPPVSDYPSTSTSTPTPSTSATTPSSSSWIQQAFDALLTSALQGLTDFLKNIIDNATSLGFMFFTPPPLTYNHKVVTQLYAWVVLVVNGMVGLFLIIGGYNYMFGAYTSFRQLAPRIVLAAIAANFSLPLLTQFIDVSNTLCIGVKGALATAGSGNLSLPLGIIHWATDPEYIVLVYVVDLLASVFLIVQMLLRLAMLDFLLIVSPLGFLCFALPQTQAWARLWVQAFITTLIVQFFQVLCIGLGSALMASFGHANSNPVTILVGIAAIFLAGKLPDMLLVNVLRTNNAQQASDAGNATIKKGAEMAAIIAA